MTTPLNANNKHADPAEGKTGPEEFPEQTDNLTRATILHDDASTSLPETYTNTTSHPTVRDATYTNNGVASALTFMDTLGVAGGDFMNAFAHLDPQR